MYKIPLHTGRIYQVGRDEKISDIVINHPRISRKHCNIKYDEERECLWIKDFSSNGCIVSDGSVLFQDIYVKIKLQEEVQFSNTDYSISVWERRKGIWFLKKVK